MPRDYATAVLLEQSAEMSYYIQSACLAGKQTHPYWVQGKAVQCESAWLSKAGQDCARQKTNQDCAMAVGAFPQPGEALFGVFDGHGPNGES